MQDVSAASAWLMIPTNGVTVTFNDKMVTLTAYRMFTPTYHAEEKNNK
jgi:hypothetical protein